MNEALRTWLKRISITSGSLNPPPPPQKKLLKNITLHAGTTGTHWCMNIWWVYEYMTFPLSSKENAIF